MSYWSSVKKSFRNFRGWLYVLPSRFEFKITWRFIITLAIFKFISIALNIMDYDSYEITLNWWLK